MGGKGDSFGRYVFVAALLFAVAATLTGRLAALHLHLVDPKVHKPNYAMEYEVPGLRGGIFSRLNNYPFAASVPVWDYHVDPRSVNLKPPRRPNMKPPPTRAQIEATVAKTLKLDPKEVHDAFWNMKSRYVPLTRSADRAAYEVMTNRSLVTGVVIHEKHIRKYPLGRLAAHVVGFVSKDVTNAVGGAGIEQRFEKSLRGIPGLVRSEKDARGREIYERRMVSIAPERGCSVYLTLDYNLQYHVEQALYEGFTNSQAKAAWAIVLDVRTGAVLALANLPTYEPERYRHFPLPDRKNRAISENFEPGSVMKTITACAVLNERMVSPDTLMNTDRYQTGYYALPGDVGHVWDAYMTVRDGLVHSSNIVYGKLAYDLGPHRLRRYQAAFGFGRKTGIELPAEEKGILPPAAVWNKASWSRAGIGQFVAVTPIQLAAAYGAIGNGGRLMRPYIVDRVVSSQGVETYRGEPKCVGTPISADTARRVLDMMLGVAKKGGTAKRAAVKGYTVAGKTGTAQIPYGSGRAGYAPGEYNGSFIGIVPASDPRIVVLVTYHRPRYCRTRGESVPIFNHQGGICAAPVFSKIAATTLRYLAIAPDVPEELADE